MCGRSAMLSAYVPPVDLASTSTAGHSFSDFGQLFSIFKFAAVHLTPLAVWTTAGSRSVTHTLDLFVPMAPVDLD
jgi:hypothetical protein